MLDIKYEKAADLKISDPSMSWESIAEAIGVTGRQLRRVRDSQDWKDYWNQADKQVMIEDLRRKAHDYDGPGAAPLYKLYFEVTGLMDPAAQEALLHMSDEEFKAEALYVADYVKQAYPSQS